MTCKNTNRGYDIKCLKCQHKRNIDGNFLSSQKKRPGRVYHILKETQKFQSRCKKILEECSFSEEESKIKMDNIEKELYNISIALIICINVYKDESIKNLNCAVEDGLKLQETLKKRGFHCILLQDKDVTKENIFRKIEEINKICKDSKHNRFIFFFAGHGQNFCNKYNEKDGYLFTYDTDTQNLLSTCVSFSDIKAISKYLGIDHQLYLFDSCFSGNLFINTRNSKASIQAEIISEQRKSRWSFSDVDTLIKNPTRPKYPKEFMLKSRSIDQDKCSINLRNRFTNLTPIHIENIILKSFISKRCWIGLSSSLSDQETIELEGNGIFTKAIIDVLEGKTILCKGNYITSHQLFNYVLNYVTNISVSLGQPQKPVYGYVALPSEGEFIFINPTSKKI